MAEDAEDTEIYITKNVTIKKIIHSLTPVEYPPTSEEGVAIIYHVEGWNNKEAAFTDVNINFKFKLICCTMILHENHTNN